MSHAFERSTVTTLVELLHAKASLLGNKPAFYFVRSDGENEASITYRELHERAMAIGGELQALMAPGQRALLLFPPGLDFVTAFFGCLYAGVLAVPAALPARNRATAAVEAIVRASNPAFILSTADHCSRAKQFYEELPALLDRPWFATDQVPNDRLTLWRDPQVDGQHTAFLQYTSGSTSLPKGVVLSHKNLLCNAGLIQQAFGNTADGKAVFWLPLYHDMGLIGGVLQPVYCGCTCTLMAPAAFLQRPALWLETISQTQAAVSGGPNFAYDLCVRKVRPEECRGLDLRHWQVAFTGAERVRAHTIQQFADKFAVCGFRREAFFPCYGLAEATLMASGGPGLSAPTIVYVRADELARNQIVDAGADDSGSRSLVGCGRNLPGQEIVIADGDAHLPCADGKVGEIWIRGSSVAGGYFQRPEATEAAFRGYLTTGEGPFLRTGDLGFLRDGQLFVTGRLKDVIIIRGRNYYPEDIENSVNSADAAFRPGFCAAISIEVEDREQLVVLQEIEPRLRNFDADAAVRSIRRIIAAQHELEVYAIALVKAGEISKTSSGKTQRSACRARYLSGQLQVISQWKSGSDVADAEPANVENAASARLVTADEAEGWLIQRIAMRTGLPPAQVHVTTPFLEFGLGSLDAVEITAELELWLGRRMSPTAVYNYPTIAALAQWLALPPTHGTFSQESNPAHLTIADSAPERLLEDVRKMSDTDLQAFILQEMAKQ